jgi:ankyrin repeat protein
MYEPFGSLALELPKELWIEIALHTITPSTKPSGSHSVCCQCDSDASECHSNYDDFLSLSLVCRSVHNVLHSTLHLAAARDNLGRHHLIQAANMGYDKAVMGMLKYGADLHVRSKEGFTLFHIAACMGHVKFLRRLLDYCKDENTRRTFAHDRGGNLSIQITPMDSAAFRGHLEIVKLLYDIPFPSDYTPIPQCSDTDVDVIAEESLHMAMGLAPEDMPYYLGTALITACAEHHYDVAEFLIAQGANINSKNAESETPLRACSAIGDYDMIKLLLENGARPTMCDGETEPLHLACSYGLEMAQLFVDHGYDLQSENLSATGWNVLYFCEKNLELVRYFLERGVSPDFVDSNGMTPLHYAAEQDDERLSLEYAKLLLEFGASSSHLARCDEGKLPIDFAMERGHFEVVALLQAHVVKDSRAVRIVTTWWLKCQKVDGLVSLCPEGCNVLFFCGSDRILLRFFLENGVDPNRADANGTTALHYAAAMDDQSEAVECTKLFLEFGASTHLVRCGEGKLPIDWAMQNKHVELVRLLQEHIVEDVEAVCRVTSWWLEGKKVAESVLRSLSRIASLRWPEKRGLRKERALKLLMAAAKVPINQLKFKVL